MALTKSKRFLYKRVKFLQALGDPKTTFESVLRAALKKLPSVNGRMEKPTGSGVEKRLINYSLLQTNRGGEGTIYGCEFIAFQEGEEQGTINVKDTGITELPVSAIKAGKDHEFLAGTVYFGVCDNHVVLCQSRGLKTKDLEDYLNWLIAQSKVLPEGNRISLNDHIPEKGKETFKGVKGIEITAPVQMEPTSPEAQKPPSNVMAVRQDGEWIPQEGDWNTPDTKKAFFPIKMVGKAWDALQVLLGENVQLPTEITVDNLTNTPEIELKIFLKWKGKHHEDDSDFLDGVASNLRHIDDEMDYTVTGKSGSMSKNDIKIFYNTTVHWTKSGRPDFSHLFPKMIDWLSILLRDSKVDP